MPELFISGPGWVGEQQTNLLTGPVCPAGPLPDHPDACTWVTQEPAAGTVTGYTFAYHDAPCTDRKPFWCLLAP